MRSTVCACIFARTTRRYAGQLSVFRAYVIAIIIFYEKTLGVFSRRTRFVRSIPETWIFLHRDRGTWNTPETPLSPRRTRPRHYNAKTVSISLPGRRTAYTARYNPRWHTPRAIVVLLQRQYRKSVYTITIRKFVYRCGVYR